MNDLGYRLVRAHDYGVDRRGDRRGDRLQSKLCWLCFSIRWERAGNFPLYDTAKRGKRGATGAMRRRWLRDEKGKLLALDALAERATHYANSAPTPMILPSGSRKSPEKQSAASALGTAVGCPDTRSDPNGFENGTLRVTERVLKSLWGISRRHLRGDSPALVARALELWRAGYPAGELLSAVRFAASWAMDSRTGDRGKIAAAVLAGRLMQPTAVNHRPPSNEEFRAWVQHNAATWRMAAMLRARNYRDDQTATFAASEGMTVEELRQKIRASFKAAGLVQDN